jgi:integrase
VRDENSAVHVKDFFGQKTVGSVNAAAIENYRAQRKQSTTRFKKAPTPATINREVTFMKAVFSWAVRNREISDDPAKHVRLEKENNIRDRVLTDDEFKTLLEKSPAHLKPILIVAYHTAMRKSEILNLRWLQVDLKAGFISLAPEDTKTNEGRRVPLHPAVKEALKGIVQRLDTPYVFLYEGKRIKDVKRSFAKACRDVGITNFRIHDLRHTAITNWRRQGHDFFTIMAASGHKSMATFKRYNTVSENDLQGLVQNAKDGHLGGHQERTAG